MDGMERLGGERMGERSSIRQVAAASFIGTTIEWYDFFLYGTAAALVFNKLFFPEFSPLAGTLLAFSTYAVGFLARPIGGIVIGHYGDKIGRKSMLILSLLIMGIATFLIGLLPTYNAIGVAAPILLVILRLAQGFGVGGEWGGAVVLAVEHAPPGKRGFYGAWPQMGVPAGLLLSTGVFTLFNASLSDAAFLSWGWRVPFLLSIVLVAVGLFIRLRIMETPAFQRVKDTRSEARMPVIEVIRTHPRNVLLAMGMRIAENGVFYVFTVFSLTYGTQVLGVPRTTVLIGVLIAAAVGLFAMPYFGWLSDRVGRRPLYLGGAAFSCMATDSRSAWLHKSGRWEIWSGWVGQLVMDSETTEILAGCFGCDWFHGDR
jgi:MFS transporter, MHS family, shikimate and dehydroshikimate transport protein